MICRLFCLTVVCATLTLTTSESCQADHGYLPHPITLNRSIGMRPPYFALHPPVYYGARYVRPYGLSPYASQSMLQPTPGYQGRMNSRFEEPPKVAPITANSCCASVSTTKRLNVEAPQVAKSGGIQSNPFAMTALVSR
ncbi:MAG: hypothetical protein AAF664_03580 [Planctomycetota bacterium]